MNTSEYDQLFYPLYRSFTNLAEVSGHERPLNLAHYTSLGTLEKIVKSNELLFSHPLCMNDHQEMRFGLHKASEIVNGMEQNESLVSSVGGREHFELLRTAFNLNFQKFDAEQSFDVYVFCMSEYDVHAQPDGLLSMWRGYGANGQGAAIVFNTNFVVLTPGSPFILAKVAYTGISERLTRMEATVRACIGKLAGVPINKQTLWSTGFHMFQLMLFDSLFSKDIGFQEEVEWRAIYFPHLDVYSLMKDQRSYLVRDDDVEPKLRFRIEPLKLEPRQTWTFDSIVDKIILGPTHATPLAMMSVKRMLECLGRPELAQKVFASGIPYRPIGS